MALRRTLPADPAPSEVTARIHDDVGATSNPASAKKDGIHGQKPPGTAAYLVTTNLPEDPSVTDAELRAIEILLGGDLKAIIAGNGD